MEGEIDYMDLLMSSDEDIESYVRDMVREDEDVVLVEGGVMDTEAFIESEIFRLRMIRQGLINSN